MNENENVNEISVSELLKAILKKWWIVVLSVVLGAVIAFAYTKYLVVPTFETTAKLAVHTIDETNAVTDANFGYVLSRDCAELITGNVVLGVAAEKLNAYSFPENDGMKYRNYTAQVLETMVTAESTEESKFFSITVTSIYAEEAKLVADMIIEAFCEGISEDELLAKGGSEGKVIHSPTVPESPATPNTVLNLLLGIVIGAAISCVAIAVVHFTSNRMQSEEWLITTYGESIPLLAVIPDASSTDYKYNNKYYSVKNKS